MGKQWKDNTKILLAFGLIALVIFLYYVDNYEPIPKLPEPAKITELLRTHYVGNVALDLPESWEMNHISTVFYLDKKNIDPEISFSESARPKNKQADEILKENILSAVLIKKFIGEQKELIFIKDLSESLGRPAAVIINTDKPRPWPIKNNSKEDRKRLEATLYFVESETILRFAYGENVIWPTDEAEKTELIAAKQKILTTWALDFLHRYKKVDDHNHESGHLVVTQNGYILIDDDLPEMDYILTAHFKNTGRTYVNTPVSLSFSLTTRKGIMHGTGQTNRTVNGHNGIENKSIYNNTRGIDKFKFWKPDRLHLWLDWSDKSTIAFNQNNPGIHIMHTYYSEQKDRQDVAYSLGSWDILLNSIRPATANDLKEQ